MQYGVLQNRISHKDKSLRAILEFICRTSNNLINCGTYLARQRYFKEGRYPRKYDIEKELKTNRHYKALCAQASQQVLRGVFECFQSFKALKKAYREGKIERPPKPPNYRKSGGLAPITYPKQAVKVVGDFIRFPLGKQVKAWFGIDHFLLPRPTNIEFKEIKEIRIFPRNREFYVEYVVAIPDEKKTVNPESILGIDTGIDNWLTCVSNVETGFIVDGKQVKSMNHWYNKKVSTLKENKPQGFWSKRLAQITEKRNRQMRDAVNKAARLVINHCLEQQIGKIVFGWNLGQRQEANLGRKTNQSFVQIPTARLKQRIAELANRYGIEFVETEESYTSKASALDLDDLPVYGEKPKQEKDWRFSGKRVKRGLYRTAEGILVNADAQASVNIIRKVTRTLDLNGLEGLAMGALTRPQRMRLWSAKKTRRNAL